MLTVETELHLRLKVVGADVEIKRLAHWAAGVKHDLACHFIVAVLIAMQE